MIGLELSPAGARGLPPNQGPLSDFFSHGGGQSVAVSQGVNSVNVWTEAGPNHAACLRLDHQDQSLRLSWRETHLAELRNVYPVGKMALTGGWSQLQSSGSGRAASYTGNRAISTASTGASAVVTVNQDAPYDLWINYTGRTSGGYVKVEIDGAQTLVNEISDPAGLGFKAFASYSTVDLNRRQTIKVASGLVGLHDISLSLGGAATPGGGTITIEAVATSASLSDPYLLPPLWTPNTAYEMGDEVQFGGMFYAARASGISGTAGPTHLAGIASDGVLDWRADDKPTYPELTAIDYASEREYAARLVIDGTPTEVGGQTHGHDVLASQVIAVDGTEWAPPASGSGLTVGSQITIAEATTWQRGAGVPIASCQISRSITPGIIYHDVKVDMIAASIDVEWFYCGMLPFLCWDGEAEATIVDRLTSQDGTQLTLSSFAWQTGNQVALPLVRRLGIDGATPTLRFVYGHEAGALPVAGNSLGAFDAFVLPNINGRSANGSLDWPAKAYISANPNAGLGFSSGDKAWFYNRHVLSVV